MIKAKDIYQYALALKPQEQAELVDKLIAHLDAPDKTIDELWTTESESWIDAYEQGQLQSVSLGDVFQKPWDCWFCSSFAGEGWAGQIDTFSSANLPYSPRHNRNSFRDLLPILFVKVEVAVGIILNQRNIAPLKRGYKLLFAFHTVEQPCRVVEIWGDVEKFWLLFLVDLLLQRLHDSAVAVNRDSSQFSIIGAESRKRSDKAGIFDKDRIVGVNKGFAKQIKPLL
jgi:hypothetical protein